MCGLGDVVVDRGPYSVITGYYDESDCMDMIPEEQRERERMDESERGGKEGIGRERGIGGGGIASDQNEYPSDDIPRRHRSCPSSPLLPHGHAQLFAGCQPIQSHQKMLFSSPFLCAETKAKERRRRSMIHALILHSPTLFIHHFSDD